MLVIVTLFAALPGTWLSRVYRQKQVLADLEVGYLLYDYQREMAGARSPVPSLLLYMLGRDFFHRVDRIHLEGPLVTDEDLALLADLRGLRCVEISDASVSNDGLKYLVDLPDLEELVISCSKPTDDIGIAHIARFRSLKTVWILNSKASLSAVERLEQIVSRRGGMCVVVAPDNVLRCHSLAVAR